MYTADYEIQNNHIDFQDIEMGSVEMIQKAIHLTHSKQRLQSVLKEGFCANVTFSDIVLLTL